jgi:hypothetical protein
MKDSDAIAEVEAVIKSRPQWSPSHLFVGDNYRLLSDYADKLESLLREAAAKIVSLHAQTL